MRKSSKYRWMVLLMISSQVLLTGFVVYWLINQYRDEKNQLNTNLTHEYLSTHDALIDSMLLKDLIAPTLKDSVVIRMDVKGNRKIGIPVDTCEPNMLMQHFQSDSMNEMQVFAFQIEDGNGFDSVMMDSSAFPGSVAEDMMVRSVRLFIDHTDESFRADPMAHAFSMHLDSSLFQLQLNDRYKTLGWNFSLDHMDPSVPDSLLQKHNRIILRSFPGQAIPEFIVEEYGGYILKLMIPQFLFALILLGISASALLMVYRSLRKQLTLNKMRDDFISNISHELQTPVSTVKVALEALGSFDLKKDPKVTGDYLEMASREVDRLGGLVGKVMNHSLLEDQSDWIQKEECDLYEITKKIIRTINISIRERGAEVTLLPVEGPCNVSADPLYIEGVITNLIDNSLKYAGPEPIIQIKLAILKDGIELSVIDDGPGIPDEYKKLVFEKFFRIPTGDRHDVKGYGLGLNFASQVMKQHGGSISQRNLPGGGCEFILHFST